VNVYSFVSRPFEEVEDSRDSRTELFAERLLAWWEAEVYKSARAAYHYRDLASRR
jgi:hypothetical protein